MNERSSLPRHSLPVPPRGGPPHRPSWGHGSVHANDLPSSGAYRAVNLLSPELTEVNPAPNGPNMYMRFHLYPFIHPTRHSFSRQRPGRVRGSEPHRTALTALGHTAPLLPTSAQSPQGREPASALSKAPKGMPICCQGGAPCSYFFLQTIFNRLTLLLTLKSTILQHTHVAHLSGPQERWGAGRAFTPSRHFGGASWCLPSTVIPTTAVNTLTL